MFKQEVPWKKVLNMISAGMLHTARMWYGLAFKL
jgi:hypothetical protein